LLHENVSIHNINYTFWFTANKGNKAINIDREGILIVAKECINTVTTKRSGARVPNKPVLHRSWPQSAWTLHTLADMNVADHVAHPIPPPFPI
jgi:hypothetical protein